jgi:alpha-glucosidase (family GH31 glycosyl hydrolase)
LQNTFEVEAYIPGGKWYDLRSYELIATENNRGFVKLNAPAHIIPLLARGGAIFPSQSEGAKTTTQR